MKRMSKNRENFFVGLISNVTLFIVGLIFILVPTYYGVNNMEGLDVNNLFLSAMLIIALLKFVEYFIIGDNPDKEAIFMSMGVSFAGIVNSILSAKLIPSYALSISMFTLVFIMSCIKIFTIDYYHDRKNLYYMIEFMFLVIISVVGTILSFSMFADPILESIEMGIFIVMLSIVGSFDITLKTILKSKRIMKKIKVM